MKTIRAKRVGWIIEWKSDKGKSWTRPFDWFETSKRQAIERHDAYYGAEKHYASSMRFVEQNKRGDTRCVPVYTEVKDGNKR